MLPASQNSYIKCSKHESLMDVSDSNPNVLFWIPQRLIAIFPWKNTLSPILRFLRALAVSTWFKIPSLASLLRLKLQAVEKSKRKFYISIHNGIG